MVEQKYNSILFKAIYKHFTPAIVILDKKGLVQHITPKATQYIQTPENYTQLTSFYELTSPDLQALVRDAINKINHSGQPSFFQNILLIGAKNGKTVNITIEALKLDALNEELVVINFELNQSIKHEQLEQGKQTLFEQVNLNLLKQLDLTEQRLSDAVSNLETSNQNLLASNEELQSTNEEYVAVNEELQRINAEYQKTIEQLSQANQDINHLLQSTEIGTLFLDADLKIRKFTDAVRHLINVIDSDIDRPLKHFTYNIKINNLLELVTQVLDSQKSIELEVQHVDNSWYLMRILPYNINNRVDNWDQSTYFKGIVLSFVNIDRIKQTEIQLKENETKFRGIFNGTAQFIGLLDLDGRLLEANETALVFGGLKPNDVIGKFVWETYWWTISRKTQTDLQVAIQKAAKGEQIRYNVAVYGANKRIEIIDFSLNPVFNEKQEVILIIPEGRIITEQLRVQRELKERDLIYKHLFDNAFDCMLLYNIETEQIEQLNEVAILNFGYTKTELLGQKLSIIWPEKLAEGLLTNDLYEEVVEKIQLGEKIRFQLNCKRKNGEIFETITSMFPVQIDNKDYAILSIRDVSLRIAQENNLKRKTKQFQTVFESSALGVTIADTQNVILKSNEVFASMLGYTIKELEGMSFIDLTYSEDRTGNKTELVKLASGEKKWIVFEKRYVRKNQSIFWAKLWVSTFENDDGDTFYLASIQDISKEKEQALLIQESQERYKTLFENSQLAILIVKFGAGGALDFNQRHMELFKGTEEEMRYGDMEKFSPFYQPDGQTSKAKFEEILIDYRSDLRRIDFEWQFCDVRGKHFDAAVSIAPLYLKGEQYSVMMIQDITERKQAEYKLKEKMIELKKYIASNLELENFAYVTSHDLREPLRTIISYTELIEHRFKDVANPGVKRYMNNIVQAASNMNYLIEDLLKFSRVNTETHVIKAIETQELMQKVQADLGKKLESEQARLEIGDLPERIYGNETQLYQVFLNFISNAIKFQHPDRQAIVQIKAQQKGSYYEFEITDNGIGIEKDFHDKIFLLFKRLHTKEKYEGTGIGLAICKKVIEKHGGEITVDSEFGKGTTFRFTLPIKDEL